LGSPEGRERLLGALRSVSEGFDVVLIDCPPALGALTRGALAWAEGVLIPLQCEFFAMEGLAEMLRVISTIQTSENPGLRYVRVLPTMFDAQLPFHQEVVQDLRKTLGETVCRTVVPRDVVLAEASSHGVPIVAYDCLSRAAHAYVQLTMEVLQHGGKASRKRP
jgi:chromosome partitioning protein